MERRLRFPDLVAVGIVRNRTTLRNKIEKDGFPPGKRTGPNERTWSESEVQAYVDACPVEPKPAPVVKGRVGRPRKAVTNE
jgi:predicted DNA-binding transcriptional regulator AlpA